MTAHPAVALLQERLPEGSEAAAVAVARAAPDGELAGWAEAAAAVADDGGREPGPRCAALLAAALLCQRGAPVPHAALSALADDVLLDAALDDGLAAAVTGLAAAAGDLMNGDDRRYLARRLGAAGATGEHVAALHLAAGDPGAAAKALAGGLDELLAERAPGDEDVVTVAHLAATWTDEHGPLFAEALAAALRPPLRAGLAAAALAAGCDRHHALVRALER